MSSPYRRVSSLSGVSFIRTLIPFMRSHHFSKILPPNSITVGVRISPKGFSRGDTNTQTAAPIYDSISINVEMYHTLTKTLWLGRKFHFCIGMDIPVTISVHFFFFEMEETLLAPFMNVKKLFTQRY